MKKETITILALASLLVAGPVDSASAGGMAPGGETTYRGAGSAENATPGSNGMRSDRKQGEKAEQGQSKTDLEITARIRRTVMEHDSLSVSAHNMKIYTRDGHVTLRGVVRSQLEKEKAEIIAENVAGKGKVTNKLQIKKDQ